MQTDHCICMSLLPQITVKKSVKKSKTSFDLVWAGMAGTSLSQNTSLYIHISLDLQQI